jgi:hypothetical protein
VIVTDVPGAGPLVTAEDFSYLRSRNFGIRLLQHPHTVDWYAQQLAAYRADDAKAVQALVRQAAGLSGTVDRLLDIYQSAITARVAGPIAGRELVQAYQRLAVVRLRNARLRAPVIGRAVQPVARALGRIFAP